MTILDDFKLDARVALVTGAGRGLGQALAAGLADDVALEHLAEGWRQWGTHPDGWFAVLHGEILARA